MKGIGWGAPVIEVVLTAHGVMETSASLALVQCNAMGNRTPFSENYLRICIVSITTHQPRDASACGAHGNWIRVRDCCAAAN